MSDLLTPPERLRRLQIEVTTYCNLLCEECSRTVGVNAGSWADKHMKLDDYRAILDNCPPAEILVLQGVGEPLLNPSLVAMVKHARDSGRFKHITLNTNAVTRSVDRLHELKEAGLTYVCVSVDSLNPRIAELCRSGTKVDKLVAGIRDIYRVFDNLVVSMVASRLNFFDIPQTLADLHQIGMEVAPTKRFVVEIVPVINYHDRTSNLPDNTLSADDIHRLNGIISLVKPQLPLVVPKLNTSIIADAPANAMCGRPFYSPFITVDGFLTPCCTTFDPAIYQHTNIRFVKLRDAWRSAPVRGWLEHYLAEQDPICKGCPFQYT